MVDKVEPIMKTKSFNCLMYRYNTASGTPMHALLEKIGMVTNVLAIVLKIMEAKFITASKANIMQQCGRILSFPKKKKGG